MEKLEKLLFDAVGKSKEEIDFSNPYREIGFDKEKPRLGWLKVYDFKLIQKKLEELTEIIDGKEYFIFVGMGGSINGIKALLAIFKNKNFFTLDSLDPLALKKILDKINSFEKLLVVPISKSATTTETQLLANTLKDLFKNNWQEHFLWLTDPDCFEKLDICGWQGVNRFAIQFDDQTDIGGRFSCPNTLIFFLPLFLLLKKDFKKLEKTYNQYINLQPKVRFFAYSLAKEYSKKNQAYFAPIVSKDFNESFMPWVIQLFQESLGSKNDLSPKTLDKNKKIKGFLPVRMNLPIKNKILNLMLNMYFFQVFIAFYSAFKKINFVSQDFVEKYKEKMRQLQNESELNLVALSLDEILNEVKKRVRPNHKFIEAVFYGYLENKLNRWLKDKFTRFFKDKMIFIFVGSDWNHHSYQAAFADDKTFYVLLLPEKFTLNLDSISKAKLNENIHTLKIISKATHLTLQDKSILATIKI